MLRFAIDIALLICFGKNFRALKWSLIRNFFQVAIVMQRKLIVVVTSEYQMRVSFYVNFFGKI